MTHTQFSDFANGVMPTHLHEGRGYSSYNPFLDQTVTAVDKDHLLHTVKVDPRWDSTDPFICLQIMQKCAPVFSVVSGITNKVSALEMNIVPITKLEDKLAAELKYERDLWMELRDQKGMFYFGKKLALYTKMKKTLIDLFPDLSNFGQCLRRWGHQVNSKKLDRADEIRDFFMTPSKGQLWNDYVKQATSDLALHGRLAIYKQSIKMANGSSRLNSLFVLPGGSVVPIKGEFVGEVVGYVQLTDNTKPNQLFFTDEISFSQYSPNSALVNGMCPVDALIELVVSNLEFSKLMAIKSDGSNTPEKLLAFGTPDPSDDLATTGTMKSDTLDTGEQRRIENKLNRVKKEAGIAILSGYGTPIALDLSKYDMIPSGIDWQERVDKLVAMVWNVPQSAVNDTGSSGTSGRSTSEAQERSENQKAIRPYIKILEETHTREIIPYSFEPGYILQFDSPMSDLEKWELYKAELDSGAISPNEVREQDGRDPWPEAEYDRANAQPQATPNDLMGAIQGMG